MWVCNLTLFQYLNFSISQPIFKNLCITFTQDNAPTQYFQFGRIANLYGITTLVPVILESWSNVWWYSLAKCTAFLCTDTTPIYAVVTFGDTGILHKSECIWSTIYVYTRESSWNPDSITLEHDRPQHDCPAACVIAQQNSSNSFVSFCFQSLNEIFQRAFTKDISLFFYILKWLKSENP